MAALFSILLSFLGFALLLQAACFAVEVVLGVRSYLRDYREADLSENRSTDGVEADERRPRVAVLIPAHNEESLVHRAVTSAKEQLSSGDRIVVIADNCTDGTATVAMNAGATVTERHDEDRRGKGYALDHGLDFLSSDPPDVVVILDADCVAEPGCLDALADAVAQTNRPAQGTYRLVAPNDSQADHLGLFAWHVRGELRLRGTRALGTPASLMGSAMAFPWQLLRSVDLAHGDLVEDLRTAIDLVESGVYPLFVPSAVAYSEQPGQEAARESQRERWIQGHLVTMFSRGPGLFWSSIRKLDINRLAMSLDLFVLPIGLLGLLLGAGAFFAFILGVISGKWLAFIVFALALVVTISTVAYAWWCAGRHLVSASGLIQFGFRLLKRIPLYAGVFFKRQIKWVRTERDD